MKVYRLAKERAGKYRADDLSGQGTALAGGRWNPHGMAVLYTCCHASTAVLEARVHASGIMPLANFYLVTLEVPDADMGRAFRPALPPDWDTLDGDPASTTEIGRAWLRAGEGLAMRVPSVVCPTDYNVLLNPQHPRMKQVTVVDKRLFEIDRRLFS